MEIPVNLKERIDTVISYVGDATTDWLRVKKELINSFAKEDRKLFSARHPCTKKQTPNAFDESVIAYWKEVTGVELVISPDKLHDTEWIHKKKGWALVAINAERREYYANRQQVK